MKNIKILNIGFKIGIILTIFITLFILLSYILFDFDKTTWVIRNFLRNLSVIYFLFLYILTFIYLIIDVKKNKYPFKLILSILTIIAINIILYFLSSYYFPLENIIIISSSFLNIVLLIIHKKYIILTILLTILYIVSLLIIYNTRPGKTYFKYLLIIPIINGYINASRFLIGFLTDLFKVIFFITFKK